MPYRVVLDTGSLMQRMAHVIGGYEWETTAFLAGIWDREGYFLDVGANVGLISIPFARLSLEAAAGSPFTGYAIEPVESNIELLRTNLALNSLRSRIRVIPRAVGERDKSVEIHVEGNTRRGEGAGTANILPEGSQYPCERIRVSVSTIDGLVAEGALVGRCTLIKIDTDGYDLFVLIGSAALLRRDRPVVFGEFNAHCLGWHGQSIRDVATVAADAGYCLLLKKETRWSFARCSESSERTFRSDCLLVPSERQELLSRLPLEPKARPTDAVPGK